MHRISRNISFRRGNTELRSRFTFQSFSHSIARQNKPGWYCELGPIGLAVQIKPPEYISRIGIHQCLFSFLWSIWQPDFDIWWCCLPWQVLQLRVMQLWNSCGGFLVLVNLSHQQPILLCWSNHPHFIGHIFGKNKTNPIWEIFTAATWPMDRVSRLFSYLPPE